MEQVNAALLDSTKAKGIVSDTEQFKQYNPQQTAWFTFASQTDKTLELDNMAEQSKDNTIKRILSSAESSALKAKSLQARFAFPEAIDCYKQAIELAKQGKDDEKVAQY